jgi:hypothetical protein
MPKFSPDGKEIALLKSATLFVYNLIAKLQEPFYRKVETTVILMAILVLTERDDNGFCR